MGRTARPTPLQADRVSQDLVGRIDSADREARVVPWIHGKQTEDLFLAAGVSKVLAHGLGHVPQGFIVTKLLLPAATGSPVVAVTEWDASTLRVKNAGTGQITFRLWVF